jgi:hypothetical protein
MDKDLIVISHRDWNLQEKMTMSFYVHILTLPNIYKPLSGHFHALERAQPYCSGYSNTQPMKEAAYNLHSYPNPAFDTAVTNSRKTLKNSRNNFVFRMSLTVIQNAHSFLIIKPTRCTNFSNLFLE